MKLKGGVIPLELQSRRPDITKQGQKDGPHENRFVNLNNNSEIISSNKKVPCPNFAKQRQRDGTALNGGYLSASCTILTDEDRQAMSQKIKYPYSYKNELPPDKTQYFKKCILIDNLFFQN